jgi:uncharacterized protein YbcI
MEKASECWIIFQFGDQSRFSGVSTPDMLVRIRGARMTQNRRKPSTARQGSRPPRQDRSEVALGARGEIEAAICEGLTRFEQEFMGRGPKDIHAHLIGDLLVVRLRGVLTAAEQHLVNSLPPEKGRNLLKEVRTHLIETARSLMEAMVQEVTGAKVISLHHDISTTTGEEVLLFTLADAPHFRETRK